MFPYLLYVMESLSRILDTCLHWLVNIGTYGARATISAYRGGTLLSTQTTSQPSVANPSAAVPEVVATMYDSVTYVSGKHSPRVGTFRKKEKQSFCE
jgi:hypothetical protein